MSAETSVSEAVLSPEKQVEAPPGSVIAPQARLRGKVAPVVTRPLSSGHVSAVICDHFRPSSLHTGDTGGPRLQYQTCPTPW
ncbi:hypothetical protein E2C01_071555 [Portunus trituberculatus]|uniref:Uncharacterized protein n=1 Tax=Portunus trituberculatus TaxID=210409 RepID=A0A5B7HXB0_PORTR|nr:hypothetical protein [Portunus trituberculatus]